MLRSNDDYHLHRLRALNPDKSTEEVWIVKLACQLGNPLHKRHCIEKRGRLPLTVVPSFTKPHMPVK